MEKLLEYLVNNSIGIASLGIMLYKLRKENLQAAMNGALTSHTLNCLNETINPMQKKITILEDHDNRRQALENTQVGQRPGTRR